MRTVLSQFLTEKALQSPKNFIFSGDHGYSLFDELRKVAPRQFINAGVSEQAMVGYAAGMTKEGMRTFVYGLSSFIPIRVLEFIKLDVCYDNLPVIFLGDGAGLVYATLGASHQCAEDLACLRALPNMSIFSPADPAEMRYCLETAWKLSNPSYIRIGKADTDNIHFGPILPSKGSFIPVQKGSRHCLIATGSMVATARSIAKKFGFSAYSAPQLTELDADKIAALIGQYQAVSTLEEHSINGGLGSIVAEIMAEKGGSAPLTRFGIRGRFTQKCGSYAYALREHGLDEKSILDHFKKFQI